MENKALRNHVIKSLQEIDVDNCELQCYLEPNCVSYNHSPSLCELNNMTHLQAPLDDMEARHGSTYRAIFYVSNMVEPGVLYHIGSIQTTLVVEEGPVTPVLCGGIPLAFGGIH